MTLRTNRPTPLDVLEHAMWDKWEKGEMDAAVKIARIAVPYRHARLQAIAQPRRARTDLQLLDDDELLERLAEARRRVIDQADP